ncbi:hypothetical protein ACFE04_013833 [Oxalis oulophora]
MEAEHVDVGHRVSLAAPFIFFMVIAFQFASRYLTHLKKKAARTTKEVELRAEIKKLLKEATALSQPSTFAQAAKLRRLAAAKEKELATYQELHNKELNLSYDGYIKALFLAQVVISFLLVCWFRSTPVAAISKQLVQPFAGSKDGSFPMLNVSKCLSYHHGLIQCFCLLAGKVLSFWAGGSSDNNIMGKQICYSIHQLERGELAGDLCEIAKSKVKESFGAMYRPGGGGGGGPMLGSGGVSDVGSKRQRMMQSNPYFAVNTAPPVYPPYGAFIGGGFQPRPLFPVVRLRGLPFDCSDIDIFKFFAGLDIVDVLLVNKSGRFSGEAFVVFSGALHVEFAIQRDRQNMGRRYVEVFRCNRQDYYNAVASQVNYEGTYDNDYHGSPPPPPLTRAKKVANNKDQMEYTEVLKMRGLPFSVKKSEIVDFFPEFNVEEACVHIACRPDGKATGEAYVEFCSAEEAKRAMCKDKMMIGSRYVELFPSTPDESRRAESRCRQ